MKNIRRALALLLCFVLAFSLIPTANMARDLSQQTAAANCLYDLGLFRGTATGFQLNRAPTRAEALTMLIRVLGAEETAQAGGWSHPFTDVPSWADNYVGYAYEQGIAKGTAPTRFDSNGVANAKMYTTFMLRALGYSDTDGLDFTYSNPFTLAERIGLIDTRVNIQDFLRADAAMESYLALGLRRKGTQQTMAEGLIEAGVFTQAQFEEAYGNAVPSEKALTAEEIYAACAPAVFYIEVYDRDGIRFASGSGFFLDSSGTAVTNYHVIDGAYSAKITLSSNGRMCEVEGVYDYDETQDWAVIKIAGSGFPYLNIGAASTVTGGAPVYAIGSPLGLQNSITEGLISNTNRVAGGVTYIQTSAAISHGSSGGALINKFGGVIGITSASYTEGQNLNLALPITVIDGYSHGAVTPLHVVAGGALTEQEEMQAEVYGWVKNFILKNSNSTDFGPKYPVYRYYDRDNNNEFFLLYSSEREDVQLILYDYSKDNMAFITYLSLTAESDSCAAVYLVERGKTRLAVGQANIIPGEFDQDAVLDFYTFNASFGTQEQHGKTASALMSLSLCYLDLILSRFGAGYSAEDYGFVNYY